MSPEQQDLLIDRYLKKQMTPDEERIFEQDLKTDPNLRARARFIAQTIKAMKQMSESEGMMSVGQAGKYRLVAGNRARSSKKEK